MQPPLDDRPSRLSLVIHTLVIALLLASFVSGLMIWIGPLMARSVDDLLPARPERIWIVIHGGLQPFLCILFGYLLCQHIRYGWELRVNYVTGALMEGCFAALILTALGLYYAPESWRQPLIWAHRVLGVFLPVSLAAHWLAARAWVKKNFK
jgi:hypothetical protein